MIRNLMREYTQTTAVRNLQKYLRQLSYTDFDIPPVPIDGIFGEATTASLKAFQKKNGLEDNGIADRESFDALYDSYLLSVKRFSYSFFAKNKKILGEISVYRIKRLLFLEK